jgi:hypothetical protein
MNTKPPFVLSTLLLAALVAACSGAATASGTPSSAPPSDPPAASPSPELEAPPGAGGGQDPGGPGAPGGPEAELVAPQPGQQNVSAVPIERFEAQAEGRTVTIAIYWASGVAPCSVLDQVILDVEPGTIAVTIREGTSDPNAICTMALQAKYTIVSLEVDPGTYTIRDASGGPAAPVEVTAG